MRDEDDDDDTESKDMNGVSHLVTDAPDPDLIAHFDAPTDHDLQLSEMMNGNYPRRADDDRVEVYMGLDIHRIIEDASRALADDPLVYQRSHELVTVVGADDGDVRRSRVVSGTPVVRPLQAHSLVPRLTRYAKFLRRERSTAKELKQAELTGDKPKPTFVECLPTAHVINGLVAVGDWKPIRPLIGVIETPSVRPDGTLIDVPGYDAATGYLYVPSERFPSVPDHPTQEDAARALRDLCDVFVDFPFASEAARFVPVAAMISIVARPAIEGPVPAFCFDAPTPGTGKSLCADAVCMIATGRAAPRGTFPPQPEELEKIMGAYAMAGAAVVGFDNVATGFGGAALDKCLTAIDTVDMRVLGRSQNLTLRWLAVVLASGNNMAIIGDTQRRVLLARIESQLERPEERTGFVHYPLLPWVHANRGRLVVAALTIVRAHALAGRPDCGVRQWGSFESWSTVVASAIAFAGGADVMGARPNEEAGDDGKRAIVASILNGWKRLDATGYGLTVRDVIRLLYPSGRADRERPPDEFEDLRESLEAVACPKPGQPPDAKRIGELIRSWKKRSVGGVRFVNNGSTRTGVARWSVQ